ncbi:MAG: 6,7-dimethyl-8-ribityllumazine synthase [Acidimicrobiales bacterium]
MAEDVTDDGVPGPVVDGAGLRVAVLAARFNGRVTVRLLDGVLRGLAAGGVADADITVRWVAGAFELPTLARAWALGGRVDAIVAVGCVIRGETAHFDLVAGQCAAGLQRVALDTGVPTIFGALTTEDLDQALARSEGPGGHNVGEEGALAAVELVRLVREAGAGGATG